MSEIVGIGVLAVSGVVPVLVARTVLAAMIAPLTRVERRASGVERQKS